MINKINALYTGKVPLSSCFKNIVYPQLKEKMSIIYRHTEPITELYPCYNIMSFDDSFYCLDYRHWYYDDNVFEKYCQRIADFSPKYLMIFDRPLDHERPWKIPVDIFIQKAFHRLNRLVHIVKNESKDTVLIAPMISVIHNDFRQIYHNFLIRNYDYFDCMSVLCCNDMSDISTGYISSALMEINKKKKPVWIFCAIPCSEDEPEIKRNTSPDFKPFNEQEAVYKMNQLYDLFYKINPDINLFYFGIDKDAFIPEKEPTPYDFWDNQIPIDLYINDYRWNWFHYLGLISQSNRVKAILLKGLLDLAEKHNV